VIVWQNEAVVRSAAIAAGPGNSRLESFPLVRIRRDELGQQRNTCQRKGVEYVWKAVL
jgi:hypothetical protein